MERRTEISDEDAKVIGKLSISFSQIKWLNKQLTILKEKYDTAKINELILKFNESKEQDVTAAKNAE